MGARASFWFACALGLGLAGCTQSERAPERVTSERTALVWNAADDLLEGRCSHAGALLGSGRALVCGGAAREPGPIYRSTCELFAGDGAGSFAPAAELTPARNLFTMSLVGDDVVAVGGIGAARLGDIQRYAAGAGTWSPLPALDLPRHSHATVVLPSGAVLVTGGSASGASGTMSAPTDEIVPSAPGGSPVVLATGVRRQSHTATLLPSGQRVLVVGGLYTANGDTEDEPNWRIFDIGASRWLEEHPLPGGGRSSHTATVLGMDVIVVGGRRAVGDGDYEHLSSVLRFRESDTPPYGQWFEDVAPLAVGRAYHTAEVIAGRLLAIGGLNVRDNPENRGALASVEVYDPQEKAWFPLEPMATGRRSHTSTVLDAGRILVAGGCDSAGEDLAASEILTPLAQGESCEPARLECVTGHCVDGKCCDRSCEGSCRTCESGTCRAQSGDSVEGREPCSGGFRCDAGACRTACEMDEHCQAGFYCGADGRCADQRALGAECASDRECLDGRPCVDGVCCERACQECEACEPVTGACKTFAGEPLERAGLAPCSPLDTECGKRCDGVNPSCQFADETTPCGRNGCIAGTNHVGVCDGEGACSEEASACTPFVCNVAGDACVERCTDYRDCELGYLCEGGACVVNDATRCRDASECGSGNCVDGYCCESRCDRQCEACDVSGREGICVFVVGAPHGERAACEGGGGECGAQCDGTTADACAYPSGTECAKGASGCDGALLLSSGLCDGRGVCETPPARDCAPGACVDGACSLACRDSIDCADTAVCEDGTCAFLDHCVDTTTAFSDELGQQRCQTGFRCIDETGKCATECTLPSHCAGGYTCDTDLKRCVDPSNTADESNGGCGCRVGAGRDADALVWLFVALGAATVLRRRRSSAPGA